MSFLKSHQVPHPPELDADVDWCAVLRWVIVVADDDSSDLVWACRFIAYAYNNDGQLTAKQQRIAMHIFLRTLDLYQREHLDCQMNREINGGPDTGRSVH